MRNRLKFLVLLLIGTACLKVRPVTQQQGLVLAQNGRSGYQIVIGQNASDIDRRAAEELQKYLEMISRARIPVVTDDTAALPKEILIGRNERLKRTGLETSLETLEDDGFLLKTVGQRMVLIGGRDKGTLYGVYAFLEDYLGCRKYSASVSLVPKRDVIEIKPIDRVDIPFFRYREVHMPEAFDDEYADWHGLDNRAVQKRLWGLWVHTFDDFLPPEKYFKDHPDYFSEVNGARMADGQLCLTNPDVFRIIVDGLRRRIQENPGPRYWSVSQNDTFYPCQCRSCLAQDERFGGPSGTLLDFVNRVAREFPDKIISTLAYQYSRSAPVNVKPEKNVNIMLCTIECNRSRPLALDETSAAFVKDITDWGRLTDNIILWDYVVQFRNYCDPFPNLRVLQPNIQFFAAHNVRMIFEQGSGASRSEFQELRAYLIAKLLWNPRADVGAIIKDFTDGYYGPAAPMIRSYIQLLHDSLEKSGGDLQIYGYPWDGIRTYLTPKLLDRYASLFDQAEADVAGDPELLKRVKFARLPLEYAVLEISKRNMTPKLSLFIRDNGRFRINPEMTGRLQRFVEWANRLGFLRLQENGTSPDEYRARTEEFFADGMKTHLALDKPVRLSNPASEKYPVGGAAALTDGLKGTRDYHFNWIGFEGTEMDAVVDLGEMKRIQSVSIDFLQDGNSWIWIPGQVEFFVSKDGVSFERIGVRSRRTDERLAGAMIETFAVSLPSTPVRFVKVKTRSLVQCPAWHKGAGGKAWIFADEIVIE
jgi:hypothetical protein